ncbi:MAG: redoxin family protein, partial [Ottowia sp.]|nr:redoxin family protein [Ottowia sp.]
WCPICKLEEHSIGRVAGDAPVLGVAMQSGSGANVARVMAQRGLGWPTLVDADGSQARAWGVHAVPAFIVIAPDGRISSASVGYTTEIGMRLRLWWAGWRG